MESDNTTPWLKQAWVQHILRAVENDPSLSIIDYQVKDASSKGEHYISEMNRITIQLQRAGNKETIHLIAKKLPPGKEFQKTLTKSSAFPNEIKTFSQVLPKFQAILERSAPGRFKPFAARHIYSQSNYPYFLIVTDLAPEGFRLATRQTGLDLDHCLIVMKKIGRYHAASIALHDSEPQLIESFKENVMSEEASIDLVRSFSNPCIIPFAKVVRSWPDGGEVMADKLLNVADTFFQRTRHQLSREGNRLNVLIHGDLHVNNLLFKYNDVTGSVEDVRFVDFQLACYTSCAIDLQYFMYSSVKDEVRVAHEEDLLREYHKELCSTLQLLGYENRAITFQELLEEYERKGSYGFLSSLVCLQLLMADPENAVVIEASLDGTDQSESSDKRAANKEYVKVMKRLLPVFYKKGYF